LVLVQGLWLTVTGLAVGLVLAFGMTRFIARLLYGIRPNDPATVLFVMLVLGALSVLACYSPALRAMRANPVAAIREH
jgi:ABC-type antimicrobial peptide transport system permease subunit